MLMMTTEDDDVLTCRLDLKTSNFRFGLTITSGESYIILDYISGSASPLHPVNLASGPCWRRSCLLEWGSTARGDDDDDGEEVDWYITVELLTCVRHRSFYNIDNYTGLKLKSPPPLIQENCTDQKFFKGKI